MMNGHRRSSVYPPIKYDIFRKSQCSSFNIQPRLLKSYLKCLTSKTCPSKEVFSLRVCKITTIALLLAKNIQLMHSQEAYSGLDAPSDTPPPPPRLRHGLFQCYKNRQKYNATGILWWKVALSKKILKYTILHCRLCSYHSMNIKLSNNSENIWRISYPLWHASVQDLTTRPDQTLFHIRQCFRQWFRW